MPLPTVAYANDEDVTLRCGADFTDILPKDQLLAAGLDGVVGPALPWALASATVDFAAQGVAPGMIAIVTLPVVGTVRREQQLVVAAVDGDGLTLRRKGQPAGVGQPIGLAPLLGCTFLVATAQPQLIRASYELNRRYGVDDLVYGRRQDQLYDPVELAEATVLTAAWKLYQQAARAAGTDAAGGKADAFWGKSLQFKRDLDELLGRAAIHWMPAAANAGPGTQPPGTRFGTRLSR